MTHSTNTHTSQNNPPELVILAGLPCSGKSSFVQNMPDSKNFTVLSSDAFIEEFAKQQGVSYSTVFASVIETANSLFNERFESAVVARANIIIDRTNLTSETRSKFINRATGYNISCIVFDTPTDIIRKRNAKRGHTGKIINAETFKHMTAQFQRPRLSEGFARIITYKHG